MQTESSKEDQRQVRVCETEREREIDGEGGGVGKECLGCCERREKSLERREVVAFICCNPTKEHEQSKRQSRGCTRNSSHGEEQLFLDLLCSFV